MSSPLMHGEKFFVCTWVGPKSAPEGLDPSLHLVRNEADLLPDQRNPTKQRPFGSTETFGEHQLLCRVKALNTYKSQILF